MIPVSYRPFPMHHFVERKDFGEDTTLDRMVIAFGIKDVVEVYVGGQLIEKDRWHLVKPRVAVFIRGIPSGPLLALIPAIASIAAAAGTTAALGGAAAVVTTIGGVAITAGTIGSIVGAVVGIVGSLALNALIPPGSQPKSRAIGDARETAYQIGGSRNQADPNGVIPILLGQNVRHAPKFMALPFSQSVGSDVYIRMAYCHGTAPIRLDDFRIGKTPLSYFDEFEHEVVDFFTDSSQQTTYARDLVEQSLNVDLEPDSYTVRVSASDTQYVNLEFVAPLGIYEIDDRGNTVGRFATLQVGYREAGSSDPFTTFPVFDMGRDGNNVVRRAVNYKMPSAGDWEIQVYRWPKQFSGADTDRGEDRVDWIALRSIQAGAPFKPKKALSASFLHIKATAQLNGTPDTYNALGSSRCLAYSGVGGWVADAETSNPGDLVRYALQHEDAVETAPDSSIDLDSVQAFVAYCYDKGFTFKGYIDGEASVRQRANDVAAAGRGVVEQINGKYTVIFDEENAPVVQHFTPENTWGYQTDIVYPEEIHGLRVIFNDEDQDFEEQTIFVPADGYTEATATKTAEIRFPGVTSWTNNYKLGRYYLAELKLRRETHTFKTDWEGLACTKGSLVYFAHDVPLIGLSTGRVKARSGLNITLENTVTLEAGKNHYIRWRQASGGSQIVRIASNGAIFDTITIDDEGVYPGVGDLYMIGQFEREAIRLKVKEIQRHEDLSATIIAVDEAPGIYDADTGPIPAYDPKITPLPDPRDYVVRNLQGREDLVRVDDDVKARLRLWWNAPIGIAASVAAYDIVRVDDGVRRHIGQVPGNQTTFDIFDLRSGNYVFEVSAAFRDATVSSTPAQFSIQLSATSRVPPDPSNVQIEIKGNSAEIIVDPETDLSARYLQVRFSPTGLQRGWNSANLIRGRVLGNSVTVQARAGTYYVKWLSPYDRRSTGSGSVIVTTSGLSNYNVVETVDMDPDFTGAKVGTVRDGTDLILAGGIDLLSEADILALPDVYESIEQYPSIGTYTEPTVVDMGAKMSARMTAVIDAFGEKRGNDILALDDVLAVADIYASESDDWSVDAEFRQTDEDPASGNWSEWQGIRTGEVSARALQFRLVLKSTDTFVTPRVLSARFIVDMPDRTLAEGNVTVPASGRVIQFDPAFIELKKFAVDIEDATAGDHIAVLSKTASQVQIEVRDNTNNPVERTIDWLAFGYGGQA